MRYFTCGIRYPIIIVNYKCGYSTVKSSEKYRELKGLDLWINLALRSVIRNKCAYFIWRSPIDRSKSFYQNKFRTSYSLHNKKEGLQKCQRLFLSDKKVDVVTAKKQLLKYTFSEYLERLRHVFSLDPHIMPQFREVGFIRSRKLPFLSWSYDVEHINLSDSSRLNGIRFNPFTVTHNKTQSLRITIHDESVLREIYRDDYDYIKKHSLS